MNPAALQQLPGERGCVPAAQDGLTNMATDEAIRRIPLTAPDRQEAASARVHAALQGGGADNITVLLMQITSIEEPS